MDVDGEPCGSDNFYDEIASFMPQPGDYTLDDLDEILRVTDAHLDSSLDLPTFGASGGMAYDVEALGYQQRHPQAFSLQDDLKFDISAFPSPATSNQSDFTPSYETTTESHRSTSTSSMEGDYFNPDELLNYFVDEDVKNEKLPITSPSSVPHRHTPSPTGSCSSSGGSSTSGVQSDISSVHSMSTTGAENSATTIVNTHPASEGLADSQNTFLLSSSAAAAETVATIAPVATTTVANIATPTAVVPISVPVLPIQQVKPITLIPVKTVSIGTVHTTNSVTPVVAPIINVEPKMATEVVSACVPPTNKSIHNNTAIAAPTATATRTATSSNQPSNNKIVPPPNAKPKTIFLSSKDFKILMQKMNGGASKGVKITGGINNQMPKIIMKTANGKVITTNKLQSLNASCNSSSSSNNKSNNNTSNTNALGTPLQSVQQQHFVPKVVKTSGESPLVLKYSSAQAATKTAAAAAAASAAARAHGNSNYYSAAPDINIYRGIVDDKMFKKQQRMIKNRESASLSRKKKKEYVVSLEERINNLEKENYTLKGENSSLRSQLVAFAQTCNCKHSNVSEFILTSLNVSPKGHHHSNHRNHNIAQSVSAAANSYLQSEHHHVKIAPKPAPKNLKQRMMAANVRKNVAVLFAMAFMVTLNMGNLQTFFNKHPIERSIEAAAEASGSGSAGSADALSGGRQLLWVESETEFNEKLSRNKRETGLEMPPPPLHFLRPNNRSAAFKSGTSREPSLNWNTKGEGVGAGAGGLSANQTEENIRLVNKLHKWIDGNDYLNLSLHEKFGNDVDNSVGFKLTPDYMEWKSTELQAGVANKQKRKVYLQQPHYESKQSKLDVNVNVDNDVEDDGITNDRNSLKLFKPKLSDEYVRLFKGIKRQDDTFYVLSFNMDHILLPASVYNKSARPKMSLLLPTGDPSLNGDVVLMQIDCEVVNTTELELKSHMIPEKLRPSRYKNESETATPNSTDVANNETRATTDNKPLIRTFAAMPAATNSKERPAAPRTYLMMGPKTQAAMKRRPTIVKLNGNASVPQMVNLSMRNSTLFAKMRETVQAEVEEVIEVDP